MKTTICAIIKDEHRFLDEWINYHLSIGFNTIHLFEDKDSISHESICSKYDNVYLRRYACDKFVRNLLKDQGTAHRQYVLYKWFGDTYRNIYDWVAFIDLDEFIVFDDDYNLNKLCNEFSSCTAIQLKWKIMSANGHINRPDCNVMDAYTKEANAGFLTPPYKSFCNLNNWKGMQTHHNAEDSISYNLTENKVRLNHYFTKSWEDWCFRIFKRGSTHNLHRRIHDFFDINMDMSHLKDELLNSVYDLKQVCDCIPEDDQIIIKVGNIRKITSKKKLNPNYEQELESSYDSKDELIIYDLGFNTGDTAIYYLNNGYKVIGVECNDKLVNECLSTYNGFILDNKLKLVNKCISDNTGEKIPFYISEHSIWSSCNINIAERNSKSVKKYVDSIKLSDLIKEYGLPVYCKIDIEGNDILAIRSLKELEQIPKYISAEAECLGKDEIECKYSILDELKDVGYNKFMIIDQSVNPTFRFDIKYIYNWLSYDDALNELNKLKHKHWQYGVYADIYGFKDN
jgi:FkbM family methyltransferase